MNLISEKEEIQRRINLIFYIENQTKFHSQRNFHYFAKAFPFETNSELFFPQKKDFEISPSDNFYLEWDTYTTLKKLYTTNEKDSKSKNIFIDLIKEKLNVGHASLAYYFLMKIGKNEDIIDYLKKPVKTESNKRLILDILLFMHCEPVYFDEIMYTNIINAIENSLSKPKTYKRLFEKEFITIRYQRLKNELEGANEELNIHKEQVIEIISKYGFPSELVQFLLEIDKTTELPDWESVNSGMIGNLSAFFEELIKNIARNIKQITKREYPRDNKKGEMGILREYIKENLKLSKKDDELVDAFIAILIKEGGHAFLSERRYFLLTKNIGIEIAYFLLSKLKDLSAGKLKS